MMLLLCFSAKVEPHAPHQPHTRVEYLPPKMKMGEAAYARREWNASYFKNRQNQIAAARYNQEHISERTLMSQPANRQLRLEIPANLNATYANAVMVSQTTSEIVFDFLQVMPNDPRARALTRVVMTPTNAKLFLKALENNLSRYEEKNGEITLPQQSTLADQLFGNLKHGDDEPTPEGTPPNDNA